MNGEYVSPDVINPKLHRFIGMFREASMPNFSYINELGETKYADGIICSCGMTLFNNNSIFEHYKDGHFDICQYVSYS